MKKIDIVFVIISLLIALTSYFATNLIYIPIGVFAIYLIYYFVLVRKRIKRYLNKTEVIHSCYNFINSFVISLSVKDSLEEAYQNGLRLAPKAMLEETNEIENKTIIERLVFLRQYFNLAIYKMFLNIVNLYQDQGGNILTLSDSLMKECTRVEKSMQESASISNKHLVEFAILWLLSIFILVFLRFALSDFYLKMLSSVIFVVLVTIYYLLFLVASFLFILKYVNLVIKEDVGNE